MPTLCSRCRSPAKIFLSETPRCESCFEHYVHRTFKTNLGRINAGGRRTLAVAISGGESSATAAVLLHRYHLTLCPNPSVAPARIVLIHLNNEAANDNSLRSLTHIQAIHDAIPNSELVIASPDSVSLDEIARIVDPSDRHELYKIELMKALATAASSAGAEGVILGTSASRAAANVLGSVTAGRGANVHSLACAESSVNGVRFLQPLKGLSIRVLVRFARLNLSNVSFASNVVPPRSIPLVIERFVCTVADDNPSSVHNVVRVAERLEENTDTHCVLCGKLFLVLRCGPNNNRTKCDNSDSCGDCEENGSVAHKALCYGCKGSVDRAGGDGNPDNAVLRLIKRGEMRKQIKDFLL